MKTQLFDSEKLSPKEIIDNLESENCGVEMSHEFIKPFSEDELLAIETDHLEKSKELNALENQLRAIATPLKLQIKPLAKETKRLIQLVNQGGEQVTEKVYCFPDMDSKLMGLYDQRGHLVGTRPMTRAERQLHIFGDVTKAIDKDSSLNIAL
jgi:hypothetical protein